MVKVSIIGATGVIGKTVAFTLAREVTVDEIVMFSRPQSIEKAKGETYDMYDALAAEDIDCRLTSGRTAHSCTPCSATFP